MGKRSRMNPGLANMTYTTLISIIGPTKVIPTQPIGNCGDALCPFVFAVVKPNTLLFPLALGQTIFFLLGYGSLHLLKIIFMNPNQMAGPLMTTLMPPWTNGPYSISKWTVLQKPIGWRPYTNLILATWSLRTKPGPSSITIRNFTLLFDTPCMRPYIKIRLKPTRTPMTISHSLHINWDACRDAMH